MKKKNKYSKALITLNGISIHSRERIDGITDFVHKKDGHYRTTFDEEKKIPVIIAFKTQKEAETAAIHS